MCGTLLGWNRNGYLKPQVKAQNDPNKCPSASVTPPSSSPFPETPSVWEPHFQVAAQMKVICGGHVEVSNKGCSRLEMPSAGGSGSPAATCCPRAGGGRLRTPGATSGSWEQGGGLRASLM